MSYIGIGIGILAVVIIALWFKNPPIYMISGAICYMAGCYSADIFNAGVTDNITLTFSLGFFVLWLTLWAFAFKGIFEGIDYGKS